MLLDPDGWGLDGSFAELRDSLDPELDARLSSETHAATIEYETAPVPHAGEARAELERRRARLDAGVREHGRAVAGSGTHPTVTWRDTDVSPGSRHRYLHEEMRELARREPTFAMHVHVADRRSRARDRTANRMRAHLPLLLALSANSPFWQGRDSGLASARTSIFQTFPRVGIPRAFDGYRDYVELARDADRLRRVSRADLRLVGPSPAAEARHDRDPDHGHPGGGLARRRADRADPVAGAARGARAAGARRARRRARAAGGEPLPRRPRRRPRRAARPGRAGARRRCAALAELAVETCRDHARDLGCEAELDRVAEIVDAPADELQREPAGEGQDLEAVMAELSRLFSAPSPARAARGRPPARSGGPRRSR